YGIEIGIFRPGRYNAITDVEGVLVGHATIFEGDSVRTGVTAVLPHGGNLFREKVLPDEDLANYETLGGLLMTALGRIPATGDKLKLPNVHLEIVDMDGNRVDKVLAVPQPAPDGEVTI
ncbi:MAG: transporter associated domain-containing protein, partial [Anaerolineales bacterium]